MSKEISQERKTLYYTGRAMTVIGLLLFSLPFLSIFNTFGSGNISDPSASFGGAFIGFVLIGIGQYVSSIGKLGKAGSGLVLDPKQAREDLKPFSSQVGGMINDALDEVDTLPLSAKEVVKVRCPSCKALNNENAKYCDQCGSEI